MSHRPLSFAKAASLRVLPLAVAFAPFVWASAACTSLTTPPAPEAIGSDTAAATPPPSSSAHAKADAPKASAAPPAADNGKLEVSESAAGSGPPAKNGDTVALNYVGVLKDGGKEFDRSRGKPFSFKLGAGNVIKGWDQGVLGMKVGSKRRLTIPPSLAYGARGYPPVIPPNSTLVFDVEMVQITPGP